MCLPMLKSYENQFDKEGLANWLTLLKYTAKPGNYFLK